MKMVMRQMAQQPVRFVDGTAREHAFVVVTQQHFIARLRNRCDQLRTKLRAAQAFDQNDDEQRHQRIRDQQRDVTAIEYGDGGVGGDEQVVGDTHAEHHDRERRSQPAEILDQRRGDTERGARHDRSEKRMEQHTHAARDRQCGGRADPDACSPWCPTTGVLDFHNIFLGSDSASRLSVAMRF
jgi:hypothetical protein